MSFNISRFDLLSMQLVVLCAEAGSLSAASRRAHCSVSTGSQRLAAVEKAVGRRLFLRDHRGLQLTEDGAVFVGHAREILAHFERLKHNMRRDATAPQGF
jgi:DNA-binding transcriptional LysR family regulator